MIAPLRCLSGARLLYDQHNTPIGHETRSFPLDTYSMSRKARFLETVAPGYIYPRVTVLAPYRSHLKKKKIAGAEEVYGSWPRLPFSDYTLSFSRPWSR